ncbi:MAG TPA: hypothetical protein PLN69_11085 [bacterium]|nr:hypothetical protein [bacterium]
MVYVSLDTKTRVQVVLLFALAGALYWGMRGAGGYGGISGAVIPGLMWGLIWYNLLQARIINNPWIVIACVLGFGLGGFNGYGQFTSWVNGRFGISGRENWVFIEPWVGYLWMFAVGAGWGGLGAHLVGLVIKKDSAIINIARLLCLPVGAVLGNMIVAGNPQIFAPLYTPEMYDPKVCTQCVRTLNTLPIIGSFWGMLLLTAVFDLVRRDWKRLSVLGIISFGFGIAFSGCSVFHTMHDYAPGFDWWKMWEMSLGAVAGGSIGIAFLSFKTPPPGNKHRAAAQFIGADFMWFFIVNWAFYNCAGRLLIYFLSEETIKSSGAILQLILLLPVLVTTLFVLARYTKEIVSTVREGKTVFDHLAPVKLVTAHIALSLMAFIVVFDARTVLAFFIVLSILAMKLIFVVTRKISVVSAGAGWKILNEELAGLKEEKAEEKPSEN